MCTRQIFLSSRTGAYLNTIFKITWFCVWILLCVCTVFQYSNRCAIVRRRDFSFCGCKMYLTVLRNIQRPALWIIVLVSPFEKVFARFCGRRFSFSFFVLFRFYMFDLCWNLLRILFDLIYFAYELRCNIIVSRSRVSINFIRIKLDLIVATRYEKREHTHTRTYVHMLAAT